MQLDWNWKLLLGLLFLLVPMVLLRIKAWMFAKTTKSSSAVVNSRQLFKLNNTVSSCNSLEQGPPLAPWEQPQPSRRNFLFFSTGPFQFSALSGSQSAIFEVSVWNTFDFEVLHCMHLLLPWSSSISQNRKRKYAFWLAISIPDLLIYIQASWKKRQAIVVVQAAS